MTDETELPPALAERIEDLRARGKEMFKEMGPEAFLRAVSTVLTRVLAPLGENKHLLLIATPTDQEAAKVANGETLLIQVSMTGTANGELGIALCTSAAKQMEKMKDHKETLQ